MSGSTQNSFGVNTSLKLYFTFKMYDFKVYPQAMIAVIGKVFDHFIIISCFIKSLIRS